MRQLCKPKTQSRVSRILLTPECLDEATCSFAFINYISKMRSNLKLCKHVYMLSSKHAHQPMRALVVSRVYYKLSSPVCCCVCSILHQTTSRKSTKTCPCILATEKQSSTHLCMFTKLCTRPTRGWLREEVV